MYIRFFNKPVKGRHKGKAFKANQLPPGRTGAHHNSQPSVSTTNATETISGISWAPGANAYVLWGDDNSVPNNDWGNTIDNLAITGVTGQSLPTSIAITSPTNGLATVPCASVTVATATTGTITNVAFFAHIGGFLAGTTKPLIASGQLKALAVLTPKRWWAAPEVPTLDESGINGIYAGFWHGIWVPKGTPKPIVEKLNAAFVQTLANESVRKRFQDIGQEIYPLSEQNPAALANKQKSEIERWYPVIKAEGIKAE